MLMKATMQLYTEEPVYSPRELGRDQPATRLPYSPRETGTRPGPGLTSLDTNVGGDVMMRVKEEINVRA
jgi:hypothetical protein